MRRSNTVAAFVLCLVSCVLRLVSFSSQILPLYIHSSSHAKGFGRNAEDGRRLETLPFAGVHHFQYLIYYWLFKTHSHQFFGSFTMLYVLKKDFVEYFIF